MVVKVNEDLTLNKGNGSSNVDSNGNSTVTVSDEKLNVLYFKDGAEDVQYICEARLGVATSEAGWNIQKVFYDTDGDSTQMIYADKSSNFSKVADNRANYTYTPSGV